MPSLENDVHTRPLALQPPMCSKQNPLPPSLPCRLRMHHDMAQNGSLGHSRLVSRIASVQGKKPRNPRNQPNHAPNCHGLGLLARKQHTSHMASIRCKHSHGLWTKQHPPKQPGNAPGRHGTGLLSMQQQALHTASRAKKRDASRTPDP